MLDIDTQHLNERRETPFFDLCLIHDRQPAPSAIYWCGRKRTGSCWRCMPLRLAFPKQETYGLTSQMRRAAVSIPANIAEGFAKRSKPDKARYMNVAEGSVEESRYYLILAHDLGYGQTNELLATLEEVSRLLNSYARSILAPGS